MPDRSSMTRRCALVLAFALSLGGCVVAAPAHITLVERDAAARATYRFAAPDAAAPRPTAVEARFAASLEQALAGRGMRQDASDTNELVLAFSSHPATLGVTPDRQEPPGGIRWLSVPRRDQPLDQCRPERVQVTVVGPGLRIRGEFDDCGPASPELEDLAREFARAIAG